MYRSTASILLFCILTAWSAHFSALNAQQPTADSLARLILTAPADTHRVILLVDYAWEINETQTDVAAERLREAVRLAQKLRFVRGEGAAWNGLGVVEEIRGNYAEAEKNYRKALGLRQQAGVTQDIASSYNNLGLLYELAGDFDRALVSHQQNLRLLEQIKDTLRIARSHFNIAGVYQQMGLFPEALTHLNEARLVLESRNDEKGMARTYTMMGHISFDLDRFTDARAWYSRALKLQEKLDDPVGLSSALIDYGNALDELDSSRVALDYYMKALEIRENLDDQPGISTVYINLGDAYKHLGKYPAALQYLLKARTILETLGDTSSLMEALNNTADVYRRQGKFQAALELTQRYYAMAQQNNSENFIQRAYKDFAAIYAGMGNFKKAYEYRVLYEEYRFKRLNEQMGRDIVRKEALFSDQKKQQEIERQQAALQLSAAQLSQTRTRNRAWAGGAIALLLLAALLFNRNRLRARANTALEAKNRDIEKERQRADDLLVNILPAATAAELKASNRVKPKRFDSVTVLFSDFKNFTRIAEQLTPEALVDELDTYFRLFDSIVERHGMEKIKTIGDAYMCAGGLPTPNTSHPIDVVRAAIEMQQALKAIMEEKSAKGEPVFEMRIGIHTGPVVAGVVGSHKFAYDIWGDTVNTAARLEQGGEAGKINISETTYQQVKDQFRCIYRGRLAAKNKGEIAMYFIEFGDSQI